MTHESRDSFSAPRTEATPGARRPRVPLFVVLFVAVLLVTLAPFTVFSTATIRTMKEALVTVQQERQLEVAGSLAQGLDTFLRQEGRESVKIAESIAHIRGAHRTSGQLPILQSLLDETVVLAGYRPVEGEPRMALAPELVLPEALEEALARDALALIERGPSPAPPSARAAHVGGPYPIGPERVLAVTVSAPVQQGGRLLGVYQEIALFEGLWTEIAGSVPNSSTIFLLNPEGHVVALRGAGRNESKDAILRRDVVQQFLRSRGMSRGAKAYDVQRAGEEARRYLGSFASTSGSWGVIVEVEEAVAFAPVEALARKIAIAGGVAAGLALLVTILLGGIISRPIARLAEISKRLASGDFSVQASHSRVRELDQLGESYNRMASRLGALVEQFRSAAREANALFLGTIRALAEAIDEKDPYTKGHSVRVNRYAVIIGRYLGLTREDLRDLHVSSLLHDVGKIGIDDAILKKPSALTPSEFETMKTHPTRGAKIMGRIPQMARSTPGMKFHHERWAGGGYPRGLKGEEIPLQARIVAVADTFDAMTTDRPYQKAFQPSEALARINDLKGIGFDPQVVEAFNRAYEAGELDEVLDQRPDSIYVGDDPAEDEDTGKPAAPKEQPQRAAL